MTPRRFDSRDALDAAYLAARTAAFKDLKRVSCGHCSKWRRFRDRCYLCRGTGVQVCHTAASVAAGHEIDMWRYRCLYLMALHTLRAAEAAAAASPSSDADLAVQAARRYLDYIVAEGKACKDSVVQRVRVA